MSQKPDGRARRETRSKLAALVELAPDIVALIDRDRIIDYVSPAVGRILGYDAGELVGVRFDELLHPEDYRKAEKAFAAMLGTRNVVTAQDRFRRKDGSWIMLETVGRNYLDVPELKGVLVCSRDISRHVELERTLRASAEQSAELFENAPCGYHSVGADGVFRRVNATELRWLQRTRDEIVGKRRFADLLAAASQPVYQEKFGLLKQAGEVRNLELEIVRKDDTTFPALLQSIAVRDDQGRFVESRTTVYDITERKSAERALAKLNRPLSVLGREHAALKNGTASRDPSLLARLSPREREVLKLVAEGHSSKEIATVLGVAPASIATYRSRLMFKLDVEDVTGLVRFAIRHGIIGV